MRADTTALTARRRLEALVGGQVLRLATEVDLAWLGIRTEALLWITVAPGGLEETGHELSRHPQVRFASAVTGPANLLVAVAAVDCRNRLATASRYRASTTSLMRGQPTRTNPVHNFGSAAYPAGSAGLSTATASIGLGKDPARMPSTPRAAGPAGKGTVTRQPSVPTAVPLYRTRCRQVWGT
ncbi:Lrp/AsnC family transcriptional regulator [Streptomyces collinus]|uniref:Lrp/AsnC family transcriptional regulator n=1 Tax=Streptomyces collinus TaxID=42684 RepID=UPI00369879B0